eukprot:scaffold1576_cov102-Isochrysis_galbana.AAC.2
MDCGAAVVPNMDCGAGVVPNMDCGAAVVPNMDCEAGVVPNMDCGAAVVPNMDCGAAVLPNMDCGAGVRPEIEFGAAELQPPAPWPSPPMACAVSSRYSNPPTRRERPPPTWRRRGASPAAASPWRDRVGSCYLLPARAASPEQRASDGHPLPPTPAIPPRGLTPSSPCRPSRGSFPPHLRKPNPCLPPMSKHASREASVAQPSNSSSSDSNSASKSGAGPSSSRSNAILGSGASWASGWEPSTRGDDSHLLSKLAPDGICTSGAVPDPIWASTAVPGSIRASAVAPDPIWASTAVPGSIRASAVAPVPSFPWTGPARSTSETSTSEASRTVVGDVAGAVVRGCSWSHLCARQARPSTRRTSTAPTPTVPSLPSPRAKQKAPSTSASSSAGLSFASASILCAGWCDREVSTAMQIGGSIGAGSDGSSELANPTAGAPASAAVDNQRLASCAAHELASSHVGKARMMVKGRSAARAVANDSCTRASPPRCTVAYTGIASTATTASSFGSARESGDPHRECCLKKKLDCLKQRGR